MTDDPLSFRADASSGAIAVVDPIEDLSSLAPLIENVELLHEILDELSPEHQRVVAKAFDHLGVLYEKTSWPADQLLRRLGCSMTTEHVSRPDSERFARCERFLGLVVRLVDLVDTTSDCRLAIMECVDLVAEQRKGTAAVETAFFNGKTMTAADIISLGEVVSGSLLARERAGLPGRELPRGRWASHLTTRRIDLMLLGDTSTLGTHVQERMLAHIDRCAGCARAVQTRRHLLNS